MNVNIELINIFISNIYKKFTIYYYFYYIYQSKICFIAFYLYIMIYYKIDNFKHMTNDII